MAKRFTDSRKWSKPFIRATKTPYKLLWLYILDDCDHAGIWQVDMEVAQLKIGEKLNIEDAIKYLDGKIKVLDGGEKWFIKDFIEFQYGELKPGNRVHDSVINNLNRYDLLDENLKIKDLISPIQGDIYKDKDKDKDKDIKGVQGEKYYRSFAHLKLTTKEFDSLSEKYSKEEIDKVLDEIQNYRKNTNYTSLFLTACKWLEKNAREGPKSNIKTALSISNQQDQEIATLYKK